MCEMEILGRKRRLYIIEFNHIKAPRNENFLLFVSISILFAFFFLSSK